jgi:predicted nucleic acid-binding protein
VKVLVDTSVWSLALRRKQSDLSSEQDRLVHELGALIQEGRVILIGPIRQELLSGIREQAMYERLRTRLRAFPDVLLETADYEEAAQGFNACRAAGVAGSAIDLLICAAATRRTLAVFTTDPDFGHYAEHLPLTLYRLRDG